MIQEHRERRMGRSRGVSMCFSRNFAIINIVSLFNFAVKLREVEEMDGFAKWNI